MSSSGQSGSCQNAKLPIDVDKSANNTNEKQANAANPFITLRIMIHSFLFCLRPKIFEAVLLATQGARYLFSRNPLYYGRTRSQVMYNQLTKITE
jgi:hypothetical protein